MSIFTLKPVELRDFKVISHNKEYLYNKEFLKGKFGLFKTILVEQPDLVELLLLGSYLSEYLINILALSHFDVNELSNITKNKDIMNYIEACSYLGSNNLTIESLATELLKSDIDYTPIVDKMFMLKGFFTSDYYESLSLTKRLIKSIIIQNPMDNQVLYTTLLKPLMKYLSFDAIKYINSELKIIDFEGVNLNMQERHRMYNHDFALKLCTGFLDINKLKLFLERIINPLIPEDIRVFSLL